MKVHLNKQIDTSYDIHFCHAISDVVKNISHLNFGPRYFIINGEHVNKLYGEDFLAALEKSGLNVVKIEIPSGEENKAFDVVEGIVESVLSYPIDRHAVLIALGGGVTGDMTGMAAALILRGIPYIQVPTTLLAQVDASVGGKTGVNSQFGKNLIGTFYQPKAVFICPEYFQTLDDRNWRTGLAEVVKYAVCFDKALFECLETHAKQIMDRDRDVLSYIVEQSIGIKKKIVEEDEKETGVRRLLNFGHTLGHAIEAVHEYEQYTHGEAISIGMVYACKLSEHHTGLRKEQSARVIKLLRTFELPTEIPGELEAYTEFMLKDKKREGDSINWILLNEIGKAEVQALPFGAII